MKKVLVIAPHADDETLGCGGTILRYVEDGYEVHWLLVTSVAEQYGYSLNKVNERRQEIIVASEMYGLSSVYELGLRPAALDTVSKGELISGISKFINQIQPEEVYTVYRNDAHSDHEAVYDAVMAATKTFRYPFIKRVLAYETISETDFGMKPEDRGFRPNVFIGIGDQLERKLEILEIYESEIGEFPFPRSRMAVEALARLRGAQSNQMAAEAFMLLKEII